MRNFGFLVLGSLVVLFNLLAPVKGYEAHGRGMFDLRAGNFTAPAGCVSATAESTFDKVFTLKTVVDCAAATVTITISAPINNNGWIGIGFGANRMLNSDIYIAQVSGGTVTVTDRFVDPTFNYGLTPPNLDTALPGGKDSVIGTPVLAAGAITTVSFVRPLLTGEPTDYEFNGGNVPVIYAYLPGDSNLNYHQSRGFGFSVDIFSGGGAIIVGTGPDFKAAHGILMIFAWIFVLILTIYLARFMKDIGPIWFRIHQVMNLIAVAISLIAWIEIVVSLGRYQARSHHILGTIVIAFSIAQPILGFLADKMFDPNRTKTPIFPDLIHNWLGRVTMICVLVTIYLGFCAYGVHAAVWAVFSLWIVLIIVLEIVSEITIGAINHKAGAEKDETKLKKAKIIFFILLISGLVFWVVLAGLIAGLRTDLVQCNY